MCDLEYSDDELLADFLECKLTKFRWTHRAHICVCHTLLKQHSEDEVLQLLRIGIRRLNESHGVANTDSSGYHETITYCWIKILSTKLRDIHHLTSTQFIQLHPEVLDPKLIEKYYSTSLLKSPASRFRVIDPDIGSFN